MRPRHEHESTGRWLKAETLGRHDDADRLFASLATSNWARVDAPHGLARRIAAALERPRPLWWDLRWVRVLLAASLAAVGGVLALVPAPALASAGVSALVAWSHALGWVLACSSAAVDTAWALWSAADRVSSWIGIVLSAPVPQFLIALNLALAAAAFVALRRLLRTEEIPS